MSLVLTKEKPIIFSTPMVQAILRNEKSMTRRIIKGEKHHDYVWDAAMVDPNGMMSGGPCLKVPYKHKDDPWEEDGEQPIIRLWPKHQVGDLLWLKEGVVTHASIPQVVGYVADGCKVTEHWEKLRNSRFMPKWAARIWLEVTGVKVERIREIVLADIWAEGIQSDLHRMDESLADRADETKQTYRKFRDLWDSINPGSWDRNDWVAAYTFRRVEK